MSRSCEECGSRVHWLACWFGITICEECDRKPLLKYIEALEEANKQ